MNNIHQDRSNSQSRSINASILQKKSPIKTIGLKIPQGRHRRIQTQFSESFGNAPSEGFQENVLLKNHEK